MPCRDPYGYALTTGPQAAEAYSRGLLDVLRLREGALPAMASAVALDPTFAVATDRSAPLLSRSSRSTPRLKASAASGEQVRGYPYASRQPMKEQ